MQIAFIDIDPVVAGRSLNDSHVNKLLTEVCQIMGCVFWRNAYVEYEPHDLDYLKQRLKGRIANGYRNHPLTDWAGDRANFLWCWSYANAACNEWERRFGRGRRHGSRKYVESMAAALNAGFFDRHWSTWSYAVTSCLLCGPDGHKTRLVTAEEGVAAYRRYYVTEKSYLLKWTKSEVPQWARGHEDLPTGSWVKSGLSEQFQGE